MKNLEVKISCPNCEGIVRIKVKDMVPGRSKPCPHCQVSFKFTGDDGRKAQRALDNLERTLKKFGR